MTNANRSVNENAAKCNICGESESVRHIFREMMFGTREEFAYRECAGCGCLQINEIPENLGDYYPENYYSFGTAHLSGRKLWLYRAYSKMPRLGRLIQRGGGAFRSVMDTEAKGGARILDVGCGAGALVMTLRSLGFDAHGIDRFAKTESDYIRRTDLGAVESTWDLIMFHHSLEHMADQLDALRSARAKLFRGGACLVRIPVVNWAWRHYGANWVGLDAPRHLVIHTPKSFCRLAEAAGFRVCKITFDSTALQFYGSELYRRDIPLKHNDSEAPWLNKDSLRRFAKRSRTLNRQHLGDQAAFYLKVATTSERQATSVSH